MGVCDGQAVLFCGMQMQTEASRGGEEVNETSHLPYLPRRRLFHALSAKNRMRPDQKEGEDSTRMRNNPRGLTFECSQSD